MSKPSRPTSGGTRFTIRAARRLLYAVTLAVAT